MIVKKIILTKNLVLDAPDKLPGESGTLIVQQDEVGGHILELAPGNTGISNVSLKPLAITKLEWVKDDVTVLWAYAKLTSDEDIKPPSKIINLVTELVDTKGVKLSWSAPEGFEGDENTLADIYHIIVSPTQFDENFPGSGLTVELAPASSGTKQSYVVSNLLSGQRYYAAIYSEKLAFGKLRKSPISNVVSFFTQSLDTEVSIPKRIPLDPTKVRETLLHIKFKDGEKFIYMPGFDKLAHQDYLIDNNGVPEGFPSREIVTSYQSYGGYDTTWYNVSLRVFFELDGIYDLDYVYMLIQNANRFTLYGSSDALTLFKMYDRLDTPLETSNVAWTKIPLNNNTRKGVKYIVMEVYYGDMVINGFVPYGTRIVPEAITGVKYKGMNILRETKLKIGTNAFFAEEDPDYMGDLSSMTRFYNNWDWIANVEFHNQGSAVGKSYDDLKMSLRDSHMWNYVTKMQEAIDSGQNILFTLTNSPICLRPLSESGQLNGAKPLDPGVPTRDFAYTTNPQNYKWMARIVALIAGKLGHNKDAPREYMKAWDSEDTTVGVGLGFVTYFEFGNETDRNWEGVDAFRHPHEQAAELSAYYDGHKGTMGPFMGIKAGDPNAKLCSPGFIGVNDSYIWEMIKWWDVHRGVGDYPIDVINCHHYNQYTDAPDTPVYSTVPAYALHPEVGEQVEDMGRLNDMKRIYFTNKEAIITEIGYGEQNGGVTSPQDKTPELRGKHKGVWLVRTQLVNQMLGIDFSCQFWYAGDTINVEDLNPSVIQREAFYTCGYMDGISGPADRHRKPLIAYWYMTAFRNAITGYTFSHVVVQAGVVLISESDLVLNLNPNMWILAYTHEDGSKCLVAWMGTDLWLTSPLRLRVANELSTVQTIDFENQHIRKQKVGRTLNNNLTIESNRKVLDITIDETPIIIKTNEVGTPKLISPSNIIAVPLSATAIKLVWTDKNLVNNKVQVYASVFPDRDFELVSEEYQDTSEITIDSLTADTNYYFKLRFVLDNRVSDLMEGISAKTFITLTPPANLIQITSTASTITIGFTYPVPDEVKTDKFLLYRSTELDGVYSLVRTADKTVRSIRDSGLIPNTTYYYKLRAEKEAVVSNFSFVVATTTIPPSFEPPVITRAEVKSTGAHIDMFFDNEMKDEATGIYAFSIIEQFHNGDFLVHRAIGIKGDEDKTLIHLDLDIPVFQDSTLTISYDSTIGNIKSIYETKMNSFNGFELINETSIAFRPVINFTGNDGFTIARNTIRSTKGGANIFGLPIVKAGTNTIIRMSVTNENAVYIALGSEIVFLHPNYFDFFVLKENGRLDIGIYTDRYYHQYVFNSGLIEIKTLNGEVIISTSADNGKTWIVWNRGVQPNADLSLFFFTNSANVSGLNLVTNGYYEEDVTPPEPGAKDYWEDDDEWDDDNDWNDTIDN